MRRRVIRLEAESMVNQVRHGEWFGHRKKSNFFSDSIDLHEYKTLSLPSMADCNLVIHFARYSVPIMAHASLVHICPHSMALLHGTFIFVPALWRWYICHNLPQRPHRKQGLAKTACLDPALNAGGGACDSKHKNKREKWTAHHLPSIRLRQTSEYSAFGCKSRLSIKGKSRFIPHSLSWLPALWPIRCT